MGAQINRDTLPVESQTKDDRILSVDVLRGFDMFWLIGGTGFFAALLAGLGDTTIIAPQFEHVEWAGFRFFDLIFPLFVYVVGMSVVFSLGRIVQEQGKRAAYKRIARRFILMYLLGVLYYGGLSHPISEIRWLGVLQRLALCYLFAGLLFCHLNERGLLAACVALLVGYWLFLSLVPLPGHTTVSWEMGENWANYLDSILLPGRKSNGVWDAEGILSTLPAVGTALLGVFSAQFLISAKFTPNQKLMGFFGAGIAMLLVGYLWGMQFPVVKKIWTSSFVLVAGGYSTLLLGLFYLIVDIWKVRWWTAPFIWIGVNPLTIYIGRNILDFNELAERFMGGSVAAAVGPNAAEILQTAVSLSLSLLLLWYLHRRRIYLRV